MVQQDKNSEGVPDVQVLQMEGREVMTETALATTQSNLPVKLSSMQDATALAQSFGQAGVMGAQNAAEGMLAVVMVSEVGLVKATANYHIMMGSISKKAHAILADFVRAGGKYKILKRDAEAASMFASKDMTEGTYTFTWEDAQKEPFVYTGKPSEQRHQLTLPVADRVFKDKYATPRSRSQMLWARLISDTCNALCPEANEGMYPPEVVADFEEPASTAGKTIDITEAQDRSEAAVPVVDYTLCPFPNKAGENAAWESMPTNQLEAALKSEKPEITTTHKAAIRLVLETRTGGAE